MMKRLREDIAPLITAIVVPLIVAITGVLAWNLNRSVAVLDNEIRAREQARLETVGDRDFHFRIYEAVTSSLETTDVRSQRVAKALVIAMLEPEDTLRSGLLEVLSAEGSGDVRVEAATALSELAGFAADQSAVTRGAVVPGSGWQTYSFDVFWCTANGEGARRVADQVLAGLAAANVTGRLRRRELAPSINASPGYRIEGLVIRREAGEEAVALEARRIADAAIGATASGFVQTLSRQGTPNYLSLFVCQ